MAADPYTGTGIVAMWVDDVLEGGEFRRLLSEMRRPTGWPAYDEALLVGEIGAIGEVSFLTRRLRQAPPPPLPPRSNKWEDSALCRMNAGLKPGGKKRGR